MISPQWRSMVSPIFCIKSGNEIRAVPAESIIQPSSVITTRQSTAHTLWVSTMGARLSPSSIALRIANVLADGLSIAAAKIQAPKPNSATCVASAKSRNSTYKTIPKANVLRSEKP